MILNFGKHLRTLGIFIVFTTYPEYACHSQPIPGNFSVSHQFGSGQLDPSTAQNFEIGDSLHLTIGGTARLI